MTVGSWGSRNAGVRWGNGWVSARGRGLDRLHQDLDALDLGDADLLACGDHSALSGAAGAPYLPGDVHQAVTGQVVDLLRDQAGGTNDPVGVGGE